MSLPILLIGAGGHAASCIDVIEETQQFGIYGLIGSPSEVGRRVLGYEVLGTDDDLPNLFEHCRAALVAVGHIKTPDLRIRLFEQLQRIGFELPFIVSPHSYVSRSARLGQGSIVMHGAIVNARADLGRNCIVNSNALIEHDAMIADHCHIATAAVLNGEVRIGAGTFIGSHVTVRQGVSIGERCVIGMGQIVLANCEPGAALPLSGRHS